MDEVTARNFGLFEIRDGEVWRIATLSRTGKPKTISPRRADKPKPDGYRVVSVGPRRLLAHRLCWVLANGAIPPDLEINHRNGIRHDNRIENLELVTKSENLLHAYRTLDRTRVIGDRNGRAKLSTLDVQVIREDTRSSRSLAQLYGVSKTSIQRIKRGQRWDKALDGRRGVPA